MKILLIDAGNTRLKWAVYELGQVSTGVAVAYETSNMDTQFAALWSSLQKQYGEFDKVVMSNVAGKKITDSVSCWAQENKALIIEDIVASSYAYGVRCAYRQPDRLGADRWAALVAARHYIKGASCIIDCGTALTIDVLTAEGDHLGGVIVPGLTMMCNNLVTNVEGISAAGEAMTVLLGSDTQSAIFAGANAAVAGAVEHVVRRIQSELGIEPTCVVTGGDVEGVLKNVPGKFCHEPDWVLKGLVILSQCEQQRVGEPA